MLAPAIGWVVDKWQASKIARAIQEDKEIDARVDEYLANHAKRKAKERALSSTCAEHLALNQKVPGSNPGGLTIIRGDNVRRRINWFLETRTAIAMSDGDVLPTKFQWRDLPRPKIVEFGMSSPSDSGRAQIRDFEAHEHKVQLIWDGMNMETFLDEVVLKQFIIRMTYDIANEVLVPSELLADANLVYKDDWVDQWGCQDANEDVIECPRELYRPANRNIKFGNYTHMGTPRNHQNAKPRIHAKIDRREIVAKIEIPDEKCFYTFRAGGFYEKDQKPDEVACETGEKAV